MAAEKSTSRLKAADKPTRLFAELSEASIVRKRKPARF